MYVMQDTTIHEYVMQDTTFHEYVMQNTTFHDVKILYVYVMYVRYTVSVCIHDVKIYCVCMYS